MFINLAVCVSSIWNLSSNAQKHRGKIYQLSKVYQQSAKEEAVSLLSLVYNQAITLIILIGSQEGIKHPMISHRNKGMNKNTCITPPGSMSPTLMCWRLLMNDCHQLDKQQLDWTLESQNRNEELTPEVWIIFRCYLISHTITRDKHHFFLIV